MMNVARLIPGVNRENDLCTRVNGSLGEPAHSTKEIYDYHWLVHCFTPLKK
jgi:hypothetical protein